MEKEEFIKIIENIEIDTITSFSIHFSNFDGKDISIGMDIEDD